ncbi:hypothetical protein JHK82_026269 [Glycine max]|nr:hypothetical protein JHK85_026887 [Glycine max]KAG5135081.1 hypothetical protein JHK82_026269 [Glycine max]
MAALVGEGEGPLWSRICVKCLPEYVMEDRLRELFSEKGEITDVKLMRTRTSRNGAEELDLEDQEDTCGKGVAHDKAQVNPEAEKVVSESCRLFVHNLPYTATDAPLYLEWAPLYLEWAPSNILSQSSTFKKMKMNSGIGENDVKQLKLEQNVLRISYVDIGPDRVQARTLFVKNLNFNTTDESLRKHFSENMKEGAILSVKVKKHLKNGKNVSMGYGFVEIYRYLQLKSNNA